MYCVQRYSLDLNQALDIAHHRDSISSGGVGLRMERGTTLGFFFHCINIDNISDFYFQTRESDWSWTYCITVNN